MKGLGDRAGRESEEMEVVREAGEEVEEEEGGGDAYGG